MKVLLTGSSGRIGRAIFVRLCVEHEVLGLDQAPASTTQVVANLAGLADEARVRAALRGVDAVVHTAALHAPQVGWRSEAEFDAVNVQGTAQLLRWAMEAGVRRFVFTSTTALYGAVPTDRAVWVDEHTPAQPRTIYHHSKLRAEALLQAACAQHPDLTVVALRMSRCFPEPAPLMAAYRLHRGVDARDVADAHASALTSPAKGWLRCVVSGPTPFVSGDAAQLLCDAPGVIRQRAPDLAAAFAQRGWRLPQRIDRVYTASDAACAALGWQPTRGWAEVLAALDRRSSEVLPAGAL